MPQQSYFAPLVIDVADGTQILNTVTETIIFPDYSFTASDPLIRVGSCWRTTVYADSSFVITTPGTLTIALRWGGVAGTVLATTGAFAPNPVAVSNRAVVAQFVTVWRTIGAAGSAYTMGYWLPTSFDPTSAATLQANLNMAVFPSAPAVVGSLDTTTAKLLSVTAKHSVATATTQTTGHIRIIESLQ